MQGALSLPIVALPACAPEPAASAAGEYGLPTALLRALAEAVLPSGLGDAGRERAVAAFEAWLAGYRPVTERDHGYGTGEITYTGAHPAPGWKSQLEALDLESRQRYGRDFGSLDLELRRRLVGAQLRRERGPLPDPADATPVALGLIAHWCASSEATDLCYGVAIGRETCRPLERAPDLPAPPGRGT